MEQQPQSQSQQSYPDHQQPTHNLSTFSTLFLVKGILTFFVSLFFLLYAGMGSFFTSIPEFQDDPNMPFNPGMIFIVVGIIGFVICVVMGILNLIAAKHIKHQRNYTFVFAIAIINCLSGILGILLGVFTIIEINKPHVKALFENNKTS